VKVQSKYVAITRESFEIFLPEVFYNARAFVQASRGYEGSRLLFTAKKIKKSAGVVYFSLQWIYIDGCPGSAKSTNSR